MSRRKLLLRLIDLGFVLFIFIGFSVLHNIGNLTLIQPRQIFQIAGVLIIVYLITFEAFGVYKPVWKYAVQYEYLRLVMACAVAGAIASILAIFIIQFQNNLTLFLMSSSANTIVLISIRLLYNIRAINKRQVINNYENRTLIIGAGWTAKNILPELKSKGSKYYPVGFVDDKTEMHNRTINGITVLGSTNDIPKLCKIHRVKTILFAIPSCDDFNKKRILNICFKTNCELKMLPYINDILSGSKPYNVIEDVRIEDLLGREALVFENEEVKRFIRDKVCLVTGGGGSIGSELCRQLIIYKPKQLLIIDNYENNAYEIQQELIHKYKKSIDLEVEIFSITDKERLRVFFEKYRPQIIFHAAAHKHVPFMEVTPEQAIKNNVSGALNVAQLSSEFYAEKFILISTDKAVRPTNVMGASKRISEKIIRMVSLMDNNKTEFASVRFGNVLDSNGSVVPLFKKQISRGGPVTVTDRNIIRYFMTISEAASLVLQAGALAKGDEVFVLDMGEPVNILELAEKLIKLSGYEPYDEIKIEFTGLRQGEKLFEELLLSSEGMKKTSNQKIFIGTQKDFDIEDFNNNLYKLIDYADKNDVDNVIETIKLMVTSFQHKAFNKENN